MIRRILKRTIAIIREEIEQTAFRLWLRRRATRYAR